MRDGLPSVYADRCGQANGYGAGLPVRAAATDGRTFERRQVAGAVPTAFLNARENAASES
jgi:hypothetical protein